MKTNISKLSFIVIIFSITIVWGTTIVLAGDNKGKNFIEGKYAATSVCYSLSSTSIPDPNLPFPNPIFDTFATSQTIWTFKHDGTGTVKGTQISIAPSKSANVAEVSWQYIYQVADDGTITMDVLPGTLGEVLYTAGPLSGFRYTFEKFPQSGSISQDHKTLTIGTVTPDIGPSTMYYPSPYSDTVYAVFYGISSCGRVLIRVHD
jgi:hypothetical protein